MQIIYSYIEPWVVQQNVYIMNDGIEPIITDKVALDDLPAYLATEYINRKCDKMILHGSNYTFTNQFADMVKTYSVNNYGLNNMNIEVIKE